MIICTSCGLEKDFPPKKPDEEHNPRFAEACQMLEAIEYTVGILTKGSVKGKAEIVADMKQGNKLALLSERIKRVKEDENEPK